MKSNEFLLVFKISHKTDELQPSVATLKRHLGYWCEWIINLAITDKLASQYRQWDTNGRELKSDQSVIKGQFKNDDESITNQITIYANDYQEAKEIASGCPILDLGGTVEIRLVI